MNISRFFISMNEPIWLHVVSTLPNGDDIAISFIEVQMKRQKCKPAQRRSSQLISYQTLEKRQLLAAVLYVDFGTGTNEFTLDNIQLASLAGPQFVSDGHALTSLETGVAATEMDLDFNGSFDVVADSEAFVTQVMENLDEIFEVFDVRIERVTSANLSEVANRLNSTSTNDAYIFVGGSAPTNFSEFGAAILDVGNARDNVGFVFSGDVLSYWMDQELRNQGQEFTGNTQFLQEFDIGPIGSWSVANEIAQRAAISFGLETTEPAPGSLENWDDFYDVMESPSDSVVPAISAPRPFSRFDNPITRIDGVSPGEQNSFQLLESNVGLKADSPYYVTMQMSSRPGWTNFEVYISSTSNGSLRIEIGDQVFEPTLAEVENGLIFNGGFTEQRGYYYNTLQGAKVIMGQLPDHQIDILNARAIEIDQTLDFGNNGDVLGNVFRASSKVVPVRGLKYFGTINDNITYRDVYDLEGDDGRDIFRVFERIEHDQIDATRDKVSASLTSNVFYADKQELSGHDGNDIFILDGHLFRYYGGNGDDFVRLNGDRASLGWGGEGYDVVEDATDNTQVYFGINESPDGVAYGTGEIERFDFTTHEPLVYSATYYSQVVIHDGDRSIFINQAENSSVVVQGGIGLYSTRRSTSSLSFFVLATTQDLTIEKSPYVQLSSVFDPTRGHTDNIRHHVVLSGGMGSRQARLVIGAQAGDGMQSLITTRFVTGTTTQPVRMTKGYFPNITIHGSDSAPDYIVVAESYRSIELFGNGGNDIFSVGYAYGGEARLNRVRGNLQFDGGTGNDLVYFHDTEASNIRVTNRFVYKIPNAGQTAPTFGLARFDGFETVRTLFSWISSPSTPGLIVTVYGSISSTYQIDLRPVATDGSSQIATNDLVLFGNDPENNFRQFIPSNEVNVPLAIRGGVWIHEDGIHPIFINRVNLELG
ncbi:MAG: hypothetical protein ACI87E_003361 [Mariniblastus sp.]